MPKAKKQPSTRPGELDEQTMIKLEEAFSFGASDMEACYYAGLTTSKFYEYIQTHPEFGERRETLKQRPTLLARQTLMKALKNDPKLALEYLDRVAES